MSFGFELKIRYGVDTSVRHPIKEHLEVTIHNEEQYFNTIKKIREMFNI